MQGLFVFYFGNIFVFCQKAKKKARIAGKSSDLRFYQVRLNDFLYAFPQSLGRRTGEKASMSS